MCPGTQEMLREREVLPPRRGGSEQSVFYAGEDQRERERSVPHAGRIREQVCRHTGDAQREREVCPQERIREQVCPGTQEMLRERSVPCIQDILGMWQLDLSELKC